VYLNTTLNTTHSWGRGKETILFPVLARDEEEQSTTQESMFNYVRLSDGGPKRIPSVKSEVQIIAQIAQRVLPSGPLDFKDLENHTHIRKLIAQVVPGFEQLGTIGETKKEFHIPGRVLHQPAFGTPSGKAQFKSHALPDNLPQAGTFQLMTVRSEGQFNTVVYDNEDLYRGQDRRDVILLNATDMAALKLKEDQLVTVKSVCGEMQNILARSFDIRAGNALMYYPEANVLVPNKVDAKSKTPAFKSIAITIHTQDGSAKELDAAEKGSIRDQSRELKACSN
jgi:anaerobic selenocysteine-containing dehydrogenase